MVLLLGRCAALIAIAATQLAVQALPVAPAIAAEPDGQQPDGQEADRLVDQYFQQLQSKEYAAALRTAGKFEPDRNNKEGRGIVAAMRGGALLGLKRDKAAAKLFAEARSFAPDEPFVDVVPFLAGLVTAEFRVSAEALDRLIARAPDQVRDIDPELMWHFLRNEPKDGKVRNEDRRVALARLGYGGTAGDYFAAEAVGILMKRGDVEGAAGLLPYIDDPSEIEYLLIQKRYAPLWPRIEALAGPHLEKVRVSSVAAARRAYAEAPDDYEKLQQLVTALRYAEQLDEAIALRAKLPMTREAMAAADEQIGWAVNNVADAFYDAGRAEEADQLFALLNEAPMPKEYWRISMKINRLLLLVRDGKFDKALPLIEPTAMLEGSPYAKQLVRRLRYCTLLGLGRRDEAAKRLPELLEHAKDSEAATVDALLCSGDLAKAEEVALASLADEDFQKDFVRELQARPLTGDQPSIWTSGRRALRQRPAIAKEFERLGRDLPIGLAPKPKSANPTAAKP